jgi:predicted GIY-YIG superfamily endonuclease
MVTVYVVESVENGMRYSGLTPRPEQLFSENQTLQHGPRTAIRNFEVLITEEYMDYQEAHQRESFLKSDSGRQWLETMFPRS